MSEIIQNAPLNGAQNNQIDSQKNGDLQQIDDKFYIDKSMKTAVTCDTDPSKDEEIIAQVNQIGVSDIQIDQDAGEGLINNPFDMQEDNCLQIVEKPQLVDYGDFFGQEPDKEGYIDSSPGYAIDRKSQQLIEQMVAQDEQNYMLQDQINLDNQWKLDMKQNERESNIEKHKKLQKEKDLAEQKKEQESKELLNQFTDKFKTTFGGLFNKDNNNNKVSFSKQEQIANKQFLKESLQQMKKSKNKTYQEMIDDQSGMIEEHVFYHTILDDLSLQNQTLKDDPNEFENVQPDMPVLNLEEYGSDQIIEQTSQFENSKPIQIYSAKNIKKSAGYDQHKIIKKEDEKIECNEKFRQSFSSEKTNQVAQQMKESSAQAAQKFKENSEIAAQKMKENTEIAALKMKENTEIAAQKMKESKEAASKKYDDAKKMFSQKFSGFF